MATEETGRLFFMIINKVGSMNGHYQGHMSSRFWEVSESKINPEHTRNFGGRLW